MDRLRLTQLVAISSALSGAFAVGCIIIASAVFALTEVQKEQQQKLEANQRMGLERAEHWHEQRQFLSCIQEIERLLNPEKPSLSIQQPDIYDQAMRLYDDCQNALVYEAEQRAQQGQFRDAITWIEEIADTSPEARRNIQIWSNQILSIAESYYNQGDLESAINVLNAISSLAESVYAEAQYRKQVWREEWTNNTNFLRKARASLIKDELGTTHEALEKVSDHPAFQAEKQELQQELAERLAEKRRWSIGLPWAIAAGAGSLILASCCRSSPRY